MSPNCYNFIILTIPLSSSKKEQSLFPPRKVSTSQDQTDNFNSNKQTHPRINVNLQWKQTKEIRFKNTIIMIQWYEHYANLLIEMFVVLMQSDQDCYKRFSEMFFSWKNYFISCSANDLLEFFVGLRTWFGCSFCVEYNGRDWLSRKVFNVTNFVKHYLKFSVT